MVPTVGDIMCADHSPDPGISPENRIGCRAARASDDSSARRPRARCSTIGSRWEPGTGVAQVGRQPFPFERSGTRSLGQPAAGVGGVGESSIAARLPRLIRHGSVPASGRSQSVAGDCQGGAAITGHVAIQSGTADHRRGVERSRA